jgi:hypothetical protein
VIVYENAGGSPGAVLHRQSFSGNQFLTGNNCTFVLFPLSTTLSFDANEEFWIALHVEGAQFPACTADGQDLAGRMKWKNSEGGSWQNESSGKSYIIRALDGFNISWLSLNPVTGTVNSGANTNATVALNASGLAQGVYNALLKVNTNDPDERTVTVPLTMNVGIGAQPDIAVNPTSHNYGNVNVGNNLSQTFVVSNTGNANLSVSSTTLAGANAGEFSITSGGGAATLTPGQTRNIAVRFSPVSAGGKTASLTITSNDPDESVVNVALSGTGVAAAPDIAVSPASFNVTLNQGQTENRTLTISNTGGAGAGTLTWSITTQSGTLLLAGNEAEVRPAPSSGGFKSGEETLLKGQPDLREGPAVLFGGGGPDAFGYTWKDSNEPGGPSFSWQDISTVGTEVVLTDKDEGFTQVNLPFAFPFYGSSKNNVKIAANGLLSFGTVPGQTWTNQAIPTAGDPNDLLAVFWDDLDASVAGKIFRHHNVAANQFIVQYHGIRRFQQNNPYTFQVILSPDGTILYQYLQMSDPRNEATVGIENANASTGLQVVFNANYIQNNLAVRFQPPAPNCNWLSAAPTGGTTNAGNNSNVTVTANASGLAPGNYNCNLVITSNDPDESPLTVPVTLTVSATAAPTISAADLPEDANTSLPEQFQVAQNYPNPFNPSTEIHYAVPRSYRGRVKLVIYNILGQQVRTLVSAEREPGYYTVTWDGTNDAGQKVASGMYLYHFLSGQFSEVKKMMMMK